MRTSPIGVSQFLDRAYPSLRGYQGSGPQVNSRPSRPPGCPHSRPGGQPGHVHGPPRLVEDVAVRGRADRPQQGSVRCR